MDPEDEDDPASRTWDLETTRSEPPPSTPEQRIGPYKVLQELGHGGMGTVYLAARADEQYQKRVAIKVINTGAGGEEVHYFRRERQILASLEHPHIARLLDGGATETGSPYLVMEFIDGQPIDEYCDRRRLPTVERLKLFQGVCSAVAYAHGKLVVHRDIKPSNILVTADGVPRLLDFGIAKFLNPELSWEAPPGTRFALTPEFASPEQVRGEPLTTATDVYSLGVLLYELLTGHRPYRLKSRQTLDVLRAVCEEEPERPSTAVDRTVEVQESSGKTTVTAETVSGTRDGTAEKLRRRLRGDLDTILLKALRKEPHQRYPSVEAFSADIRSHLEGRPISARGASAAYRTQKFIRRHVVGVSAASVIALLLIGFALSVAVQSARLARERDKAERVSAFLVDLFKVSDPGEARGNTITARELLDKGAARIRGELGEQPEVKASLLGTMARVYSSLGLYDKAQPLQEEALQLRRQAFGQEHPEVAESLYDLAGVLEYKGNYAGAEALYREALAMRREVLGREHPDVAKSLNNLATVLYRKGDQAGAEALYREALAMKRKLLGREHPEIARSLHNLAIMLANKGDAAGAEALYRESLEMKRRLLGREHPDIARSLNNLGLVLAERGDYAEAEAVHREALAMRRKLLGNEHPDVAPSLSNLASVLADRGDYAGAEPLHREAVALSRKLLGNEHPNVARSLSGLATALNEQGDAREAEPLLREALAIFEKRLPKGHPDIAVAESALGGCLVALHRYDEAEVLLLRSYAALQSSHDSRGARDALGRLVDLYESRGKREEAARYRALLPRN